MLRSPLGHNVVSAMRLAHVRINHHEDVIAYLEERGIGIREISDWGIGFWEHRDPIPALYQRVVFPILDFTGTILLAITGREFYGQEPKYWHTRFNKRYWLYGLWKEPISVPIIVEGMGDCIALRKLGWFALATMGTSLTKEQAALLALYGDWCIILPHRDAEHVGEQWRSRLEEVGVGAVLPVQMYPADAPSNADPDWMVQKCPDLLKETLLVLEETGKQQFGSDPAAQIIRSIKGGGVIGPWSY